MTDTDTECPACGGPLASDGVCADDTCGADDDLLPYPCPRTFCDEEFATGDERVDHLVNDHGEAHASQEAS